MAGKKLTKGREFVSMLLVAEHGELTGISDGIRADEDGNIWAAAGWGGAGVFGRAAGRCAAALGWHAGWRAA